MSDTKVTASQIQTTALKVGSRMDAGVTGTMLFVRSKVPELRSAVVTSTSNRASACSAKGRVRVKRAPSAKFTPISSVFCPVRVFGTAEGAVCLSNEIHPESPGTNQDHNP